MNFTQLYNTAAELDAADPLKGYISRFYIPDKNLIYLDGNSLGRPPLTALTTAEDAVRYQWGERLIRGWNEGWYNLSAKLSRKLASVIGCNYDEVIITDSTSVNLYKLADAALRTKPGKTSVVTDEFNFPSDIYILQGVIRNLGSRHSLTIVRSPDSISMNTSEILSRITEETALVCLSLVSFKSGYLYDMKTITDHAHKQGALVLWDLSHAAGAVECRLSECGADMAVGCTYKYLNGGPGAPGYLYIRKDLIPRLYNPVQGWFGQDDPFGFDLQYSPAPGISRFLTGTPPVLSLAPLHDSLSMIVEADISAIRKKSTQLTALFYGLCEEYLFPKGFTAGSPADPASRGSHVSLRHPEAYRICKALTEGLSGTVVIPDFREPDNIRFGFSPLYNTYHEAVRTVEILLQIMEQKLYESVNSRRDAVT